jgi:hypothetical protein
MLLVSGVLLVIGLIGEYKLPFWHPRLEFFELLVLIGCAGELLADGGVFVFSERLQKIEHTQISDLAAQTKNAKGDAEQAKQDAGEAKDKAQAASDIAGPAKEKADAAKTEADGVKTVADQAEQSAKKADAVAAKAESDLAASLERTARLEALLSWRTVTPEQKSVLRKLLFKFRPLLPLRGLKISFQYVNQNPEAEEYSNELKDAIDGLGAEISDPMGAEFFGVKSLQGVIVVANPVRNQGARVLSDSLNLAGIPVLGQRDDNMDEHDIKIIVALKPRTK